jgi:RimJ/RimL family protein N-acetyltransferase
MAVSVLSVPSPLPPWPRTPPAHGGVVLREFRDTDLPLALELSTDPYVPVISSLPERATDAQALDWIRRQRGRWAEGTGFSFAVAEADTGRAVGQLGLWLAEWPQGRAEIGYMVSPGSRGHGVAAHGLIAATAFAWTIPGLHRIELHIEPWNTASLRTAERAGYERDGLLRSHQELGGRRRDMALFAAIRPS